MSGDGEEDLEKALLAAHARDDRPALANLYRQAADRAEQGGDIGRACFYLTHAWVFALETGGPDAESLRGRLAAFGRA